MPTWGEYGAGDDQQQRLVSSLTATVSVGSQTVTKKCGPGGAAGGVGGGGLPARRPHLRLRLAQRQLLLLVPLARPTQPLACKAVADHRSESLGENKHCSQQQHLVKPVSWPVAAHTNMSAESCAGTF